MRYKIVPPVRDIDFLYDASAALPLVPGSVEDCCTRIRDATDVPSRDVAREYLTFLQALGLAAEATRGFHRVRATPDEAELADRFRDRVFGVREVIDALTATDRPLSSIEAFESVRGVVPRWERARHDDWEDVWHERVDRLLGWAVHFGLARETADGYVSSDC